MTPDITLHGKLDEAARRIRLVLVVRWVTRFLCWSTLACLLWMLGSKFGWLREPEASVVLLAISVSALVGLVAGATRRFSSMDVALLTDRRLSTRDRLASAIEFEKESGDDPLVRQQIADAGAHARALDLRKAYPVKLSREAILFFVFALALFGSFWLPTVPLFWSQQKRDEVKELKQQAIAFERIARDTQKTAEAKKLDESKKAAQETQKLAEAMKKGSETKKTAMIKLAKLTKNVEEQHKRAAQANGPATKPVAKAGEEIKKALEQQQKAMTEAIKKSQQNADAKKGKTGEQQSDKEKLAQKSGKSGEKNAEKPGDMKQSEAMKEAQLAMQKFSQALMDQNGDKQNEALKQLAQQLESGQMSKNEMQTLQQQLQQMADALKGTELNQAAQQMQKMAEMMKQLKLDPETLKKLAQMARQAGGT